MAKPQGPKDAPKKRRQKSHHATADVKEAIFAHYCVKLSYASCARKFGMPISTVFGIINERAGGPADLERIRTSKRADLIERAFRAAGRLIPVIKPSNCGSVATSKAADASRAMEALVRAGHLMTPDVVDEQAPTVINVFTGMRPPPELEAAKAAENLGPTTTSTAEPTK